MRPKMSNFERIQIAGRFRDKAGIANALACQTGATGMAAAAVVRVWGHRNQSEWVNLA